MYGSLGPRRLILLTIALFGIVMLSSLFYAHNGSFDPQAYKQSLQNSFNDLASSAATAVGEWREPESAGALGADLATLSIREPRPQRDFSKFQDYEPFNMEQFKKDRNVFATLYCSHTTNPDDPYLAAVQSMVWRLLWSPYASKHPVVVFVCPFIRNEVRNLLRAQGAWIEELPLLHVKMDKPIGWARWEDQFSKLNLWSFTKFNKIAYLDTDAFPIANPDRIFEIAKAQQCKFELLAEVEDLAAYARGGDEFCQYVYAGVRDRNLFNTLPYSDINGGLLVLQPNLYMHERLVRNVHRTEEYDTAYMEQSFLSSKLAFNPFLAFPPQEVSPVFNFGGSNFERLGPSKNRTHDSAFELRIPEHDEIVLASSVVVLHDKLWLEPGITQDPDMPWWLEMWAKDWLALCHTYDGQIWDKIRKFGRLPNVVEARALCDEFEKEHGFVILCPYTK